MLASAAPVRDRAATVGGSDQRQRHAGVVERVGLGVIQTEVTKHARQILATLASLDR